jgi:hypothetical protein
METIKNLRIYMKHFDNKILKFIILKLMSEIEKDLIKYKNNPFGITETYSSISLKGLNLLSFLTRRYLNQ